MAKCPLCGTSIKDDFGLVECEGCSVQLIVHADDRVEYLGAQDKAVLGATSEPIGETPPPIGTPGEELAANFTEDLLEPHEGTFNFGGPEPERELDVADEPYADPPSLEPVPEDEPTRMPSFAAEPPPIEEEQEAPSDFDSRLAAVATEESEPPVEEPVAPVEEYNFDDAPGDPAPPAYTSADSPSSPDLSDVARFGNSDISGGRDGALRYTLFIDGIDTSDVRLAFREALTDRKFVWDIDTILRSVRNGEVTIPNVSPAKAYILISRLRGLPLSVRWEQYAIHQT